MRINALRATLLFSITTLATSTALAGSATIKSADGELSTFEYNGQMLRVGMPQQEDGYLLVRDNAIYTVMQTDGRTLVFDASSAMKSMGPMLASATPNDLNAEVVSLEKTGRTETIAGIKGDVYDLRFVDENGNEQSEEMVLSDDPRALEFRDALFVMMGAATTALATDETMDSSKAMRKQLESMDTGMLRYGQDMTLTKIDSDRVDPERFTLPAEPMDMSNIGAMMSGMSAGASSADTGTSNDADTAEDAGVFSSMMGAIGSKINRQADRVSGSAENEVDKETDEKVDGVVSKAFGKLFGR